MSNDFIVEPNGPDVMITVNGKSVIIPKECLDELCKTETIGPFWEKLKECVLATPEIVNELNEFYKRNKSNPELLHKIMDEIKKFCN